MYRNLLMDLGINFTEHDSGQFNIYNDEGDVLWGILYTDTQTLVTKSSDSGRVVFTGIHAIAKELKAYAYPGLEATTLLFSDYETVPPEDVIISRFKKLLTCLDISFVEETSGQFTIYDSKYKLWGILNAPRLKMTVNHHVFMGSSLIVRELKNLAYQEGGINETI